MEPRVGLRLAAVLIVALAAIQIAFRPVGIAGRTPTLQSPALHVNLGLDLQGGSLLVLEGRDSATVKATRETVDDAMRVIERRIDQLGVAEPNIQRQGLNRIIVELPGIQDPQRAISIIGKTALLEFVDTGLQSLPEGARWTADGKTVILPTRGSVSTPTAAPTPQPRATPAANTIRLEKKVILTGADLQTATAGFDQQSAAPIVSFQFRGPAGKKFEDFTAANVGKHLTIALDNVVISSPVIRDRISGGSGQISGGFQVIEEARDLAVLLRGGSLPIPVEVVENRTVGPQLGRDSIDASLRAGLVAVLAVTLFMLLYYGFTGLLADLALGVYTVLVLAMLVGLGATLTLPGIAGLVMSIGMAVDANVLIFEKMKEELRAGKTLRAAIAAGWNRAMSAILDSNVSTLLAALVLFALGTGPVRGFAVTLGIGVAISLFTAIVVTRALVDGAARVGLGPWLQRITGKVAQ